MKIALLSLDQRWEDKEANLLRCRDLVARAAGLGADLAILPEMTLTGFTFNTTMSAEDPSASATLVSFGELAGRHEIGLVAGLVLNIDGQPANTLVAFDGDGTEQARYTKIHPFSFAGEDRLFLRGERLARMAMLEFRLGLSICYDLRFPELFTALAKDCDVLVNIANWPQRRVRHWRTLLRARAIENQVFVVGVNRTGTDGKGLVYEHSSMVVDANGEVVPPIFHEGEIDIVEIHAQALANFRRSFSTRQDRRPDLYRVLI